MSTKSIFLIGATGGLGGHILNTLLQRDDVKITAYVRSPSKLSHLSSPKLMVVQGDLSSLNAQLLTGYNVVISTHSSGSLERYRGYQAIVSAAQEAQTQHVIGVGGAGQLKLANGEIKQSEPEWFPDLAPVTEDHEKGLNAVKSSGLQWTWVAPPYMPQDAPSCGGYLASNDLWNGSGMIPQIDVAQFIADEALDPKHTHHVVALKAP